MMDGDDDDDDDGDGSHDMLANTHGEGTQRTSRSP